MTEKDTLVPQLKDLRIFGDGTFKDVNKPIHVEGDEWVAEGEFSVLDKITLEHNQNKPFYKKHKGNKDGNLGYVYPFIACSPGFLQAHPEQFQNLNFKPIVMDTFNKEKIEDYLKDKINNIGPVTFDKLIEHLNKFADVDYDRLPSSTI